MRTKITGNVELTSTVNLLIEHCVEKRTCHRDKQRLRKLFTHKIHPNELPYISVYS
jgi:hypothetical protein